MEQAAQIGALIIFFIAWLFWLMKRSSEATVPASAAPVPAPSAEPVPEAPKQPVEDAKVPEPIPEPPKPKVSCREHLYAVAKASLGTDMSPEDRAPDSLGCMESVNGVWLAAFGEQLLAPEDRLSTARGYASMRIDKRLRKLADGEEPLPGDIVISPTGMSTIGAPHGHTGIRGVEAYMSNDSSTGKWTANYNLPNWKLVFHDKLGFPVFHFRPVGDMPD